VTGKRSKGQIHVLENPVLYVSILMNTRSDYIHAAGTGDHSVLYAAELNVMRIGYR